MTVPRFFTEPFRARTWKETAYSLVSLPVGVFWFSVLLTLLVVSVSTFFLVGIPLLVGTLLLAHQGARLERALSRILLDQPIRERPSRTYDWSAWRDWLKPLADSCPGARPSTSCCSSPFGLVSSSSPDRCSIALGVTAPIWYCHPRAP